MIDISALNTYIVYASLNPEYFCEKNNGRRNFFITLGKILGGINEDEEIQRGRDVRVARKRKRETEEEVEKEDEETEFAGSTKEKRGRCYLCERSKDRKYASTCSNCRKYLCPVHSSLVCSECLV